MKRKSIISIMLLFTLAFAMVSCEKDFLDINTDPNNPAESSVQLTLPAGIASSAYVIGGYYQLLGGFWAQHWTQSVGASQWRELDAYNLQSTDFDTRQWGQLYAGALSDLKWVRDNSRSTQNWSYYLMTTAIQAYTYQVLADLYDKIPFSEALQGLGENTTPKWDNGQDVYDALIVMLNEALSHDYKTFKSVNNPTATALEPGTDDVIFGGNMDKWEQFVNTLKLKIYLHQSYKRPTVAQAGIQQMFTANAPFLTSDAVFANFENQQNKRNPVYETFIDRLAGNISVSKTIFSFLNANADPRLPMLINKNQKTPAQYVCLAQGDFFNTTLGTGANIQNLSTPVLNPTDPVVFFSASESYFMQAEAVLRMSVAGDAKALYEQGINASFTKLGVTGASTLYGAGGPYEYPVAGTEEQKLEKIIVQKWVAMTNFQSLEAFLEQSRTHYPKISTVPASDASYVPGEWTISLNNTTANQWPKRLLFPESERKRNPNTPALVPLTTKVWWDVKP